MVYWSHGKTIEDRRRGFLVPRHVPWERRTACVPRQRGQTELPEPSRHRGGNVPYKVRVEDMEKTGRGCGGNEARQVAIWLARERCGGQATLREIGKAMGGMTRSGVSTACRRVSFWLKRDTRVKRIVAKLSQYALNARLTPIRTQNKNWRLCCSLFLRHSACSVGKLFCRTCLVLASPGWGGADA